MSIYDDKQWVRKTIIGGLILLLCPPLGWVLAMGYRRAWGQAYVKSTRDGTNYTWPEWRDNFVAMFIDGVKVWCIIIAYLLPSLVVAWGIILGRSGVGAEQGMALAIFIVACILLLPIGLPAAVFSLYNYYPWFTLRPWEATIVVILFGLGVFLIPSGFVRVSLGGEFTDALPNGKGLRLLYQEPAAYCKAWVYALVCCLAVLGLGPLAPFGIFWSYQVTVKLFADVALNQPVKFPK